MSAVRRIFFIFFSVLLWVLLGTSAYADNIMRVRAFSNSDKTRVVLDLDFEPKYSTALNDNGASFVVRVNDVDNYRSAPASLELESRSVIKKFTKNLSGDDVRYIFDLQGSGTPNVFVLKPMDGRNYRLVLDFPHTASERTPAKEPEEVKVLDQQTASKLKGTGQGAGIPPVKVITIDDADAAENALLSSLSTVGSDGIRTMTPAQVQAYQERMAQLRNQQAAQQALAQQNQQKPKAQTEEEVQDTPAPPSPLPVSLPEPNPYIIAIDAGHGGKDPGAIGKRGVREKNVTLAIATQLAKYVNSNPRFRGRLIRSTDVFVDLDKRSEIARSYKADILISIHADSVASGSSARGASIWVLSNNRAQRENNKVLQGDGSSELLSGVSEVLSSTDKQNPYLAATILSMSSDNTRSEGYNMGQEILDKLGKFTKLHKKQPIHASLAVLKSPDIPSLLIETGFLSNRYEEIQLNQPNYQKQIAYCIYQGIVSYYEKYTVQRIKTRVESAIRTGSARTVTHTVQKGDSLSVLAQRYNSTVSLIKARNQLKNDNIRIGQKLEIPQMR
ncbi:MAG TPA: N-acetylmuramoyl-L-alanine amidase [Candidatus Anaerobiospirillum pullistercoris]|uniref:N-acetylmuramoyl-L-alanine amidase n=1 Tax=Candidatus Anaerobiospirillum pullistercoris TaxID=2838452 RepID=A0A9D2B0S9_9GAMM|nr:N-acetylmuramoyl-L-alanine amidase [Candidatus Anaerobiospirillum pullistercoris]